jgi:hypothetical protein
VKISADGSEYVFPIRRVTAQGYSPLINDTQPFVSNTGSIMLSFVAAYPSTLIALGKLSMKNGLERSSTVTLSKVGLGGGPRIF